MRSRLLMAMAAGPAFLCLPGCGGGSRLAVPPPPVVNVSVTPPSATVRASSEFSFHATVAGSVNTAVTWAVNGIPGGSATLGTVDGTGLYMAPSIPPSPPVVGVTAVAAADSTKSATANVTVTVGITVVPAVAFLLLSTAQCPATQQFTAVVSGTDNPAVGWSVNGLPGGDPNTTFGSVTADGLYTSPTTIPNPPNFKVAATSLADPNQSGGSSVTVSAGGSEVNQNIQTGVPIFLGTSGGNANNKTSSFCCSGTLGALVTRNGADFILSNNHVLARNDQATPGEPVTQPGLVDNKCMAATVVANFSQAAQLQSTPNPAPVDAALAQVMPGAVDPAGAILQLGSVSCGGLAQPAPPASTTIAAAAGMLVAKSGRTTGLTCGNISTVATDGVKVQYQTSCGSTSTFTLTFNNQIVIESSSFGDAGDSGSLIVDAATAEPTGLLFAGDFSSGIVVANPIQDVLAALPDPSNQALPAIVGGTDHPVEACIGGTAPAGMARSSAQALNRLPEAEMARARIVKGVHLASLTSDPSVLGVGVGAGTRPDKAAIVVFVERGKQHRPIPDSLDGISTRVKTIGRLRAFGGLNCSDQKTANWNINRLR